MGDARDEAAEHLRAAPARLTYAKTDTGWRVHGTLAEQVADASGRTLAAARGIALELLVERVNAAFRSEHGGRVAALITVAKVEEDVDLPPGAERLVAEALQSRLAAREAADAASAALTAAVLGLDDSGLSLRDAAHLLELSHARVAQVLGAERSATRTPDEEDR